MSTLRCPRCSQALHLVQHNTHAVGPCFECGGLWLSVAASQTVQAALGARASHAAAAAERDASAPRPEGRAGGALLTCPDCDRQMERWPVGPVEVDHCSEHGTWYDRGELQDVQRHLTNRFRPIGAPQNAAVEDSGLELARDPRHGAGRSKPARAATDSREQLEVVHGMACAEQAYQRHQERKGAQPDESSGGFLGMLDDLFDDKDDEWRFD